MSEKPWCDRCRRRHEDRRAALDAPLFADTNCPGQPIGWRAALMEGVLVAVAGLVLLFALSLILRLLPLMPVAG